MRLREAIERMMTVSRYSARQLSIAMGKHPNFVSSTFTKGSVPRVDTLAHMAGIMGYRLVLERDDERLEVEFPAVNGSKDGEDGGR